jgi:hypothetical protein
MRLAMQESRSIRKGAAAAELAMWLPFLAVCFVIALDFCRVYFVTQTVQNCARAGALYASGNANAAPASPSVDPIVQAVLAEGASLNPAIDSANVIVSSSGGSNQVSVSYDFVPLVRWPGIASPLTITRTVTMKTIPTPGT